MSDDLPRMAHDPPAGSAILRAFRVLGALAQAPDGLSLADLCRQIDLPKPTVFRILHTLEHEGLVLREPGSRRFLAGPALAQLAATVLAGSPQRASRRAIIDELVENTGETCNLTVPNGHELLYLERVEVGRPVARGLRPGSCLPLYVAASGKLFLSELPDRARDRYSRQVPRVPYTSRTLVDRALLEGELRRIRAQGHATEFEEYLPGRCCIAVPVRGPQGRLLAALSLEAAADQVTTEQLTEFLQPLKMAAKAIAGTLAD